MQLQPYVGMPITIDHMYSLLPGVITSIAGSGFTFREISTVNLEPIGKYGILPVYNCVLTDEQVANASLLESQNKARLHKDGRYWIYATPIELGVAKYSLNFIGRYDSI